MRREAARRPVPLRGLTLTERGAFGGSARPIVLTFLLFAATLSPAGARGQDALWVGRVGVDTAVVEAVRSSDSRISGTIVNVAIGLIAQHYEVDLDEEGRVRSLRSWRMDDFSGVPPTDAPPSMTIDFSEDSIRVKGTGPNGAATYAAVSALPGAVPIFDAFFNNPISLIDLALRQARARGDGKVRLFYVSNRVAEEFPLSGSGPDGVAFPYLMARFVPMVAGARLRATMDADGMAELDARETTFKIVTERRPWADPLTLARDFKQRGLGANGFGSLSPPRTASGRVGPVDVQINYGQPRKRGRRIFPDVVPFEEVWRAGANAATRISFSADVIVGGEPVPAGSYSLWVVPSERVDTLIFNKVDRTWGTSYDETQDLVRVPLERASPPESVEALLYTIRAEGDVARIEIAWDDRVMSVLVEPAPGGLGGR